MKSDQYNNKLVLPYNPSGMRDGCEEMGVEKPCKLISNDNRCFNIEYNCGPCHVNLNNT